MGPLIVHTDASISVRGTAIGFRAQGEDLDITRAKYVLETATSQQAEGLAIRWALTELALLWTGEVILHSDNQVIVIACNKGSFTGLSDLIAPFERVTIKWIGRGANRYVDRVVRGLTGSFKGRSLPRPRRPVPETHEPLPDLSSCRVVTLIVGQARVTHYTHFRETQRKCALAIASQLWGRAYVAENGGTGWWAETEAQTGTDPSESPIPWALDRLVSRSFRGDLTVLVPPSMLTRAIIEVALTYPFRSVSIERDDRLGCHGVLKSFLMHLAHDMRQSRTVAPSYYRWIGTDRVVHDETLGQIHVLGTEYPIPHSWHRK